jgi:phage terminase Nu1 subunit (DNA packaging protein)
MENKSKTTFGKAIRWTILSAAQEFGLDEKTLNGRIRRSGELAGKDGCYSTAQICGAVFGDLEQERTRLVKTQADIEELCLAEKRNDLVPVQAAFLVVSNMFFAVRRIILMSELTKEKQDAALKELEGLKPSDFVTEEILNANKEGK